jgi:hypothetical protein
MAGQCTVRDDWIYMCYELHFSLRLLCYACDTWNFIKCRFKDSRETLYCSKCHIPEDCIFTYLPYFGGPWSTYWPWQLACDKCVCDVSEPFQTSLKYKMATSLWLIDNHVQLMQSCYSESHGWCQWRLKVSYILAFLAFLSSTFLVCANEPKALNISEG